MRLAACAYAQCHHHECYLRDGRECENSLDVGLHAGHYGGIQRSEYAYVCYGVQHAGGELNEQREHPCSEEYARNNHCCRVYECRNRCRAFHRVRQPYMQGEHRALSCTSYEHQHQGCGQYRAGCGERCLARGERECLHVVAVDEYSDEEEEVGKTGDDECLLGCRNGCGLCVVEAYEKV